MCSVKGCGKKHTKFLHSDVVKKLSNSSTNVKNVNTNTVYANHIFMPIVPIIVNDVYSTYALLDNASTGTFCSRGLAELLGVKGHEVQYKLSTLGQKEARRASTRVNLRTSGVGTGACLDMSDIICDR